MFRSRKGIALTENLATKPIPSDEVRTGDLTDMTGRTGLDSTPTHRQAQGGDARDEIRKVPGFATPSLPPYQVTPPSLATEIPRNPNLSLSKPGFISNAPSPITPGTKAPVPGGRGGFLLLLVTLSPGTLLPAQPSPALIILLLHGGGSVMGCADYAAALTYCNYRLNCWEAKKHLVYLTRKDRYWG